MGSYTTRIILALVLGLGAVASSGAALAQEPPRQEPPKKGIKVQIPPLPGAPEVRIEPTQPRELNRVREEEYYPERVGARHEAAFIHPLTGTIPTGPGSAVKAGAAGWTAPRVPHDDRESSGAIAFGFTLSWGAAAPAEREKAEQGR